MSSIPDRTSIMNQGMSRETRGVAVAEAETKLHWPLPLPFGKSVGSGTRMGQAASPAARSSRSPSPVESTVDSDSNWYAGSSSSLATTTMTSATGPRPMTECGFGLGGDEDCERAILDKWDRERPQTPVDRFKAQQGRSGSRPSGLRNTASLGHRGMHNVPETKRDEPEEELESETSDSSEAECDESDNHEEEPEDMDNDWSGQDGNLESAVIDAVSGDLGLAAFLIPLLHRSFVPATPALRKKVESWQQAAAGPAPTDTEASPGGHSGSGGNGAFSSGESPGQGSNPRKRARRSSSASGGLGAGSGDGDDGDDDDDPHGEFGGPEPPAGGAVEPQRLACPFHKLDAIKYSTRNPEPSSPSGKKHRYRTCQGPGFKSIQRLKEHLKRTHYPVQCERCFAVFAGKDRAAALQKLTEHRRAETPCPRNGDAKLAMDGIDEAQWAVLERQNRKKNQEKHRVERYYEIWDVLFPGVVRPESPWHEDSPFIFKVPSSPSTESETFTSLFLNILDHKVQQRDMTCPDDTRERLKNVVQSAFNLYVSVYGPLPRTETSSSGTRSNNHLSSLGLGRSSVRFSGHHHHHPGTGASHTHTHTLSTSTAATSISVATAPHPPPHLQQPGPPPNAAQYTALNCNMPSTQAPGAAGPYGMTPMMVRQPTGSPGTFPMPGAPMPPPPGAGMPVFNFGMGPEDPNAYHAHHAAYYNFGQRSGAWPYQAMAPQSFSMPPNMQPNMPAAMPGNMPGSEMDFGFGEAQNFGPGGEGG